MNEEKKDKSAELIFSLDTERRREIDGIKTRMEDFLKSQIELKHCMDMVTKGQEQLKERFETGTARTLKELKDSFDQFRVEWGRKLAEDDARDKAIIDVKADVYTATTLAEDAKTKAESIIMGFAYTIFGSTAVCALIWALSKVLTHPIPK